MLECHDKATWLGLLAELDLVIERNHEFQRKDCRIREQLRSEQLTAAANADTKKPECRG
jgi:hypothetical protein